MSKLCCIPICPNSKADRGVPCYPFPSADEALRAKWIEFVVGPSSAATTDPSRFRWKNKHICAEHFHELDLVETGEGGHRRSPADGAVPVVYSLDAADDDVLVERDPVMVSGSTSSEKAAELHALFCRICLRKATGLIPFNTKLHNENLIDVIYSVTGLKLDETEANLPRQICANCVQKVDLAFNVRKDFMHCETVLRNIIRSGQLQVYYQCYDNHRERTRSKTDAYLSTLMKEIKTEMVVEPVVVVMEEEHLFEEEENAEEQPAGSTSVEHDALENTVKVEILSDSEQETEEKPPKQIVYSWKELYKPKRTRTVREYKIKEDLPEPDIIPFTCYICHAVHEDADALDSHVEEHVSLVPYTCDHCSTKEHPLVMKSLVALNKHLQTHLYPYICDYCPLRYPTRKAYIGHMKTVHVNVDSDGFTCDDCGQHFTNQRHFYCHIYKHKAIKEGKYKCKHCGKAFGNRPLLARHERIHTGEKPYECKKCFKRFNHESNFQDHKKAHIGEKAHVCPECDKRFLNVSTLRYHLAEHFPNDPRYRVQYNRKRACYDVQAAEDEQGASSTANRSTSIVDGKKVRTAYIKERVCEFENCTFKTTTAQSWHYHQATHTRKFQCEVCARRFPTKQVLVKHVETAHEGKAPEKTKPCPYCERKFSSNQKLRCHVDMHENNRRHKCNICDKAFVQVTNLTAHLRTHTGEKPYVCRACPAAFITSSARRKHEKTHPQLDTEVNFDE